MVKISQLNSASIPSSGIVALTNVPDPEKLSLDLLFRARSNESKGKGASFEDYRPFVLIKPENSISELEKGVIDIFFSSFGDEANEYVSSSPNGCIVLKYGFSTEEMKRCTFDLSKTLLFIVDDGVPRHILPDINLLVLGHDNNGISSEINNFRLEGVQGGALATNEIHDLIVKTTRNPHPKLHTFIHLCLDLGAGRAFFHFVDPGSYRVHGTK